MRFRTVAIAPDELFAAGWLNFVQPLTPPYAQSGDANSLERSPSHRDIREFAIAASERFLTFWYRVFDVAAARALAGQDTAVFTEQPFMETSTFFDIGIPDEPTLRSVPPLLHAKLLEEYRQSRDRDVPGRRIFYLSNYLSPVTADVSAALDPYRELWRLKARRRTARGDLEQALRDFQAALWPGDSRERAVRELDAQLLAHCDRLNAAGAAKRIADASVRQLLHRRRQGDLSGLLRSERELLGTVAPANDQATLARLRLPDRLARLTRSAAAYSSMLFRLAMRAARQSYYALLRAEAAGSAGSGTMPGVSSAAGLETRLRRARTGYDQRIAEIETLASGLLHGEPAADAAAGRALTAVTELRAAERELVLAHAAYRPQPQPEPETSELLHSADESDPEDSEESSEATANAPQELLPATLLYGRGADRLDLALESEGNLQIGNPFHEARILRAARNLIVQRLRPVRRTASDYSLNPAHRHGAVCLNPVMKLWKDRPEIRRDGPELTRLELNTRQSTACLLELATLVDPQLGEREVRREKIVREKRGPEGLANLLVLLLPGSCYPLREIDRQDFPEFRAKVIGETRSPAELGVQNQQSEDAILTGGWYQKRNHTLYYPVGGDHGRLLRLIWTSGRSPGPPAFFFALGQFVHDCLEDGLVYYKTAGGEQTFRECVEDYYREEDRVRKNRGERSGRRRLDNSRPGVRFMFAVAYARTIMEALTGSSQSQFRHAPTEKWFLRNLGLPILAQAEREKIAGIRRRVRELLADRSASLT